MRGLLLVLVLGLLILGGRTQAGRVGEGPSALCSTASVVGQPAYFLPPDTSRKALRPDSVGTAAGPALVPEEDKPTRQTSIRIVVAIVLLTVTTLLLYNVRSR